MILHSVRYISVQVRIYLNRYEYPIEKLKKYDKSGKKMSRKRVISMADVVTDTSKEN